jgi:hypothetical protein
VGTLGVVEPQGAGEGVEDVEDVVGWRPCSMRL